MLAGANVAPFLLCHAFGKLCVISYVHLITLSNYSYPL